MLGFFEGTVGFLQASWHWINMSWINMTTCYTIYKYFKCKTILLCFPMLQLFSLQFQTAYGIQ